MIATSIEQSKHLLELGLDTKTADCKWVEKDDGRSRWFDLEAGKPVTAYEIKHCPPAWSLSALFEVMPSNIGDYDLYITKHKYVDGGHGCNVEYNRGFTISVLHKVTRRDLVTAAYEMVCWLLEQGLIKKGDNDE